MPLIRSLPFPASQNNSLPDHGRLQHATPGADPAACRRPSALTDRGGWQSSATIDPLDRRGFRRRRSANPPPYEVAAPVPRCGNSGKGEEEEEASSWRCPWRWPPRPYLP